MSNSPNILDRDCNLAELNIKLMQDYELHIKGRVRDENEKLAQATALMEDIERFLQAFEKDQEANSEVDWRKKPEGIQLVEKIREQVKDDFPEMFPTPPVFPAGTSSMTPGAAGDPRNEIYFWNKDEAKTLKKHVNSFIDNILHSKVSQIAERVLQHEQDMSKVAEIFGPFVKRWANFLERIITNTKAR